jgi:hypothetical protein
MIRFAPHWAETDRCGLAGPRATRPLPPEDYIASSPTTYSLNYDQASAAATELLNQLIIEAMLRSTGFGQWLRRLQDGHTGGSRGPLTIHIDAIFVERNLKAARLRSNACIGI